MAKSKSKAKREPKEATEDKPPDLRTETILKRLGDRIRSLREKREWTQTELGEKVALSQKYLSEIERGTKALSFPALVGIAHDGLGINLAMLLASTDHEIEPEIMEIDQLLAGYSKETRREILRGATILIRAGLLERLGDPRKE